MNAVLSEDRTYVTILWEDKEPQELTVEEFVACYGEEALPRPVDEVIPEEEFDSTTVKHYYDAFRRLLTACGKYAWADKTEKNDADGVYPVQKVVHETFGANAAAKLALEVSRSNSMQKICVENLDYWSRRLGYKPMSEKDKQVLIRHLYGADFRKRMRYRVKKYAKRGELYSARELVLEVLRSFLDKSSKT